MILMVRSGEALERREENDHISNEMAIGR